MEVIAPRTNSNIRIPIKIWATDLESGALEQAINMSALPFAYHHIAIMPDSHQGYGMPIGGVLATKGVVIPNAVGVDIGCGMCAKETSIDANTLTKDKIKKILERIREKVPVGFNHHKKPHEIPPWSGSLEVFFHSVIKTQWDSAVYQIGTLGGGNHFIELQKNEEGRLWIMIHSGSRNLGHKVATHYNNVAKDLNKKWYSSIPKEHELAFLPIESDEAKRYMAEMNYCITFAELNRRYMMMRCQEAIIDTIKTSVAFGDIINKAHNFAAWENHFNTNVIVHRKGATIAREGELGMIPGSQGTCSYIVEGKGNPDSFSSCSHGAGRVMGRKEAQRRLSVTEEAKKLDDMGVVHSIRTESDLDEAPSAYKNINDVMANQMDLIRIKERLTPLGVIKG